MNSESKPLYYLKKRLIVNIRDEWRAHYIASRFFTTFHSIPQNVVRRNWKTWHARDLQQDHFWLRFSASVFVLFAKTFKLISTTNRHWRLRRCSREMRMDWPNCELTASGVASFDHQQQEVDATMKTI